MVAVVNRMCPQCVGKYKVPIISDSVDKSMVPRCSKFDVKFKVPTFSDSKSKVLTK